jgi:photosystem II stability/assembly factor-like uncharacterized protein
MRFNKLKHVECPNGLIRMCFVLVFCCLLLNPIHGQQLKQCNLPDTLAINTNLKLNAVSFRGLSVLNKQVFWCSGSKGVIAKSVNKGAHLQFTQIEKYAKSDFRDIHVFNRTTVLLSSSGFPALMLKTFDEGQTWIEVFSSNDSAVFIDGIDFNEKKGVMLSDPIQGKFMVYLSNDMGDSWQLIDTATAPKVSMGESAFAASGSCIQWLNKNSFAFVSGGTQSNLYVYNVQNKTWKQLPLPIVQGTASQGAFSFSQFKNKGLPYLVIVGGDYTNDSTTKMSASIGIVDLKDFRVIASVKGFSYQSCVKAIDSNKFLTTGTNGTEFIHFNEGTVIDRLSLKPGFNVIGMSKNAQLIVLAGSKGRIAIFEKD